MYEFIYVDTCEYVIEVCKFKWMSANHQYHTMYTINGCTYQV